AYTPVSLPIQRDADRSTCPLAPAHAAGPHGLDDCGPVTTPTLTLGSGTLFTLSRHGDHLESSRRGPSGPHAALAVLAIDAPVGATPGVCSAVSPPVVCGTAYSIGQAFPLGGRT